MEIDTSHQQHKFIWDGDESKYTLAASNYKKYMADCLSSSQRIQTFLGERVISKNRVDRTLWVTMAGLPANASDLDIILKIHCVSINDLFWFNEIKDNSYWFDELQYMFIGEPE
jgi:hypothetical protein